MLKRWVVIILLLLLSISAASAQDEGSTLQSWGDSSGTAFNISRQVEWPVYTSTFRYIFSYHAAGDVVPSCVTSHSHSVWHTFVAPQTGRITLSTQGSNYDAMAAVFVNTPTLANQIACFSAVTGAGTWEDGSIRLTAGTRYYVMLAAVDDGAGVDGVSTMTVTYSSNNNLANAFQIPASGNYSNEQTNIETSSPDFAEWDVVMGPGMCGEHNYRVYYRFRPRVSGRYTFSTNGSTYDTVLVVRNADHKVGCNEDLSGSNGNSRLEADLTGGMIYFIIIGQADFANPRQTDNMVLMLRVRKIF